MRPVKDVETRPTPGPMKGLLTMKPLPKPDLHATLSALLNTRSAGAAVSRSLMQREAAWRDKTVIADLRARRARAAYDEALDDLDNSGAPMARGRGVRDLLN